MFALWSVAGATAVTVAAALRVLWLRARVALRTRRESRFVTRWRPLLLESIDSMPSRLPPLRRREWQTFLALWNSFHDSLRGPARHRLRAMALRLRMDLAARELLRHHAARDRLLAIVALGNLGDSESWERIERLARSDHALLSLTAARALLMIDARRAIDVLLSSLMSRDDWPLARVKAMLTDAGPDAVSQSLVSAIDLTPPTRLPRLVSLMDCARADLVTPELIRLLEVSEVEEVLVACLKSVHAPRDRSLLAGLAAHSSWQVRTQAVRALGQVAAPGDESHLISLLADPVWWVRYRAAQALAQLPFLSRDDLWRLRFTLTDKFAQNMLDQAVSERSGR